VSSRERSGRRLRVLHWLTKGALAISDQAFFAGAHFLLNVLLARWVASAEYGSFALAYSVFVLVGSLHLAIFVEPMLVFGASRYRERFEEYLGILLRGQFFLTVPASVCMVVAALLIRRWSSGSSGNALLAMAFATPSILLLWVVRRAFYVKLQPAWAMCGSVLYLVVLVAILAVLHVVNGLSAVSAFVVMSVGAMLVSSVLLPRLHPEWVSRSGGLKVRDVALAHWRYARWSVAAAGAGWIPMNIYYLMLPAWFGLEEAAGLRVLMNLVNPVQHFLMALGPLLLPALVRHRLLGGKRRMNRTMMAALCVFLVTLGLFSGGLWTFRALAFQLLYGGKYQDYSSGPLLLLLLSLLASSVVAVVATGLMALERPDNNFWSYVASSVVTLAVGLPLAAIRGVQGAAEGLLLSGLVSAGFMAFFYWRAESHEIVVPSTDYLSAEPLLHSRTNVELAD